MTKEQVQANIALIEARFPGLRMSNRYAWTHKVAYLCYTQDMTVTQKRADPGRPISDDTIALLSGPLSGTPGQQFAVPFEGVDLLDGATGAIHWNSTGIITDQLAVLPLPTDVVGNGTTPIPPQPPTTVVVPGREEALDEMHWLDAYYAAPEGLQRPNGLSLNGKPDFEGIAAWYLDVYQQERMKGKSRADARAAYVNQIRHSEEWITKHPGETP